MNPGVSDDPSAPVFFFSYARQKPLKRPVSPSVVNAEFRDFFTRLSEDVGQQLALLPGQDPGFIDERMEAGDVWSDELVWAAGSCQIFVPLLSPAYVMRSEWCAMEWDLFAHRKVFRKATERPSKSTAIIPVLWAPMNVAVPPIVKRIQMFSPTGLAGDTEALYRTHGVLGLLRMGRRDDYGTVVWTLAQQIIHTSNSLWVEPQVPEDTTTLRRTFLEEA